MKMFLNIGLGILLVMCLVTLFDSKIINAIPLITLTVVIAVLSWMIVLNILFHKTTTLFFVEKQKFKIGEQVVYANTDYFILKHGKCYVVQGMLRTVCCNKILYNIGAANPDGLGLYTNTCSCGNEHLHKFILCDAGSLVKYTEELTFSEKVELNVLLKTSESKTL